MSYVYRSGLVSLLLLFVHVLPAAVAYPARDTVPTPSTLPAAMDPEALQELTQEELEARLGRELTRRERKAFRKVQRRAGRYENYQRGEYRDGNGLAIAGFVLGVLSILTFGLIGWLTGPLALIFSILGLEKSNREGRRHKGLAIAGIVLGGLATLLWALVIAVVVAIFI